MPLDAEAPWGFPTNWNLPLGSSPAFFDRLKKDIAQAFQGANMSRQDKDIENEKVNFVVRRKFHPAEVSFELAFGGRAELKGQFPNHFDLSVGFVIAEKDTWGVELLYHAQGVPNGESKLERTHDLGSCSITNVSSDANDTYNSCHLPVRYASSDIR
jgi:hypothetical protein